MLFTNPISAILGFLATITLAFPLSNMPDTAVSCNDFKIDQNVAVTGKFFKGICKVYDAIHKEDLASGFADVDNVRSPHLANYILIFTDVNGISNEESAMQPGRLIYVPHFWAFLKPHEVEESSKFVLQE